ncbi:MAG: hypothetical protein NHB32_03655 [Fischerella sp. CENA71]|nr:hypothetical protein [Fischerella sp. CENA71]
MQFTKPKKHVQPTQENHEFELFEDLTDEEIEKVCGGVTKLDFEEFKADFKLAKIEFTAEFLTLKF